VLISWAIRAGWNLVPRFGMQGANAVFYECSVRYRTAAEMRVIFCRPLRNPSCYSMLIANSDGAILRRRSGSLFRKTLEISAASFLAVPPRSPPPCAPLVNVSRTNGSPWHDGPQPEIFNRCHQRKRPALWYWAARKKFGGRHGGGLETDDWNPDRGPPPPPVPTPSQINWVTRADFARIAQY